MIPGHKKQMINFYVLLIIYNREFKGGKSLLPLFILKVLKSQVNDFMDQTIHNRVERHLAKKHKQYHFL